MTDTEVFKYQLIITGRLKAHTREDAEARIKAGLTMTLPLHESVDSLVIHTETEEDELRRRFK